MSGFSNPIVGGGGALVYPSIHSPDFVTGVSGWSIDKDGSAEFDDLTIRGTFNGTDFVLNSAGLFIYAAAPATGNLIESHASSAGVDGFGNTYFAGDCTYSGNTSSDVYTQVISGNIRFGLVSDAGTGSGGSINLLTSPVLQLQWASPQPFAFTDDIVLAAGQFVWAATDGQGQTKETWHTLPPAAGWSQSTPVAQVRKVAGLPNECELVGDVTGGTVTSGTQIFTLPSGYAPAQAQDVPVMVIGNSTAPTATPRLHVQNGGAVLLEGLPATTTEIRFNGTYHLDL